VCVGGGAGGIVQLGVCVQWSVPRHRRLCPPHTTGREGQHGGGVAACRLPKGAQPPAPSPPHPTRRPSAAPP
jgi:hypothetical protein